jgi:transposase
MTPDTTAHPDAAGTRQRNQGMLAERRAGLLFREIAERHGVSKQRVRMIVREQERREAQAQADAEAGEQATALPTQRPIAAMDLRDGGGPFALITLGRETETCATCGRELVRGDQVRWSRFGGGYSCAEPCSQVMSR